MAELNEMALEFQKLLEELAAEEQQELKSIVEGGELELKMSEDLESEYTNLTWTLVQVQTKYVLNRFMLVDNQSIAQIINNRPHYSIIQGKLWVEINA